LVKFIGSGEAEMHRMVRLNKLKMSFFYVYVLQSINLNFIYVGFTHDLKRRFREHNKKQELSTKHYAPFNLIHYEAYRNEKDAKRREEYLKKTKGKTTLKTMLREYFLSNKI
jgi:putative endonuclease